MTSLLDDEDSDDDGRHQYDQHHNEAQRDDARLLGDRMTMRILGKITQPHKTLKITQPHKTA